MSATIQVVWITPVSPNNKHIWGMFGETMMYGIWANETGLKFMLQKMEQDVMKSHSTINRQINVFHARA